MLVHAARRGEVEVARAKPAPGDLQIVFEDKTVLRARMDVGTAARARFHADQVAPRSARRSLAQIAPEDAGGDRTPVAVASEREAVALSISTGRPVGQRSAHG